MKDQRPQGVARAMQAGRGFYLDPDPEGGQGDPSPEGAGDGKMSTAALNAMNAAITGRLKDAGLADIKDSLKAVQDTLQGIVAGQGGGPDPKPKGPDPAAKPGSLGEMQARLAAVERENAQLRDLNDAGTQSLQQVQKRTLLNAALVGAGMVPDSVQLQDTLGALMSRDDIKATGKNATDGAPIWEGQVNTQAGPNPNATLRSVVQEFLQTRQHLLPPVNVGAGTGSGDGIVPPGPPGTQPVTVGALTVEQVQAMNPAQLDKVWELGGGQPVGDKPGMYPLPLPKSKVN